MNPGSVHDSELFKKLELLLIIQMKILHIKIMLCLITGNNNISEKIANSLQIIMVPKVKCNFRKDKVQENVFYSILEEGSQMHITLIFVPST